MSDLPACFHRARAERPARGVPGCRNLWLLAAACAVLPMTSSAAPADTAPPADAKCAAARSRLAQEEAALVSLLQTIEDDRRARADCKNKSACEHYDASLAALAKRKERRDARIENAQADVARLCKPPSPPPAPGNQNTQ